MTLRSLSILAALTSLMTACATSGTHPQDMSTSGHEAAAQKEEAEAAQHAGQFEPNAQATISNCTPSSQNRSTCWTSTVNPTETHRRQAERHSKAAAAHRAASQKLVAAEAASCADIPEEDRIESPFAHSEDIVRVTLDDRQAERLTAKEPVGATVVFRSVPGLTAEWLQRLVDCHLARNAAMGFNVPEMDYCPLAVEGVTAQVSSVGNGFAVELRAKTPAQIAELRRRAQALSPTEQPAPRPVSGG